MATIYEHVRWNLWKLRNNILVEYGVRKQFIQVYDQELLNKLHSIYYGGLPISLLLLNTRLCRGQCYDKALLVTLGLQEYDYQQVDADVDYLALSPYSCDITRKYKLEHFGNHCFIEATIEEGKRVVYDTTRGLRFDRNLYYRMYHPKITKFHPKEEVQNYIEYQEIMEYNQKGMKEEKHLLPVLIPLFEQTIESDGLYEEIIHQELERFKEEMGYEKIIAERNKEKIL